jgi:RimJ/RimL family protein N-acetyltransferase
MAKAWINSQTRRYEQNGFGQLAVIAKATGTLIGSRGFRWAEYQGQQRLHSTGAFKPAYWRQGFGSESAACMYDFVFQHTNETCIFARCHLHNKASQANLTQLGFVLQEQISLPQQTIFTWCLSKKTWGERLA